MRNANKLERALIYAMVNGFDLNSVSRKLDHENRAILRRYINELHERQEAQKQLEWECRILAS